MADITVHGKLQLSPIQVDEKYAKEWNERSTDFVMLTKNGQLISNNLYRVGGFGADITKDYFMILKYVEAYYSKEIMDMTKGDKNRSNKHLEGRWVIIDKEGVEKVEFKHFTHGWIVDGSCIYYIDRKYYNIETKEFYCEASSHITSSEYIFIENRWDKDESKRGVIKINKKDGTWELFS